MKLIELYDRDHNRIFKCVTSTLDFKEFITEKILENYGIIDTITLNYDHITGNGEEDNYQITSHEDKDIQVKLIISDIQYNTRLSKQEPKNARYMNVVLNYTTKIDKAIFLAFCGASLVRDNFAITGIVRLQMARDLLDSVISKIESRAAFDPKNKEFTDMEDPAKLQKRYRLEDLS